MAIAGVPTLPGGLTIETILAVLVVLLFIFYISIRVRKYAAYLKESGARGFGASMIVLGVLLFIVGSTGLYSLFTHTILQQTFYKLALWLVIMGAAAILLDWLLQKMRKKDLMGLEEERRDYITRVKKGITNDAAEKIALDKVRKSANPPGLKMIASQLNREKLWEVYMKDTIGKYYKVSLDVEGEVRGWESMNSLPDYMIEKF